MPFYFHGLGCIINQYFHELLFESRLCSLTSRVLLALPHASNNLNSHKTCVKNNVCDVCMGSSLYYISIFQHLDITYNFGGDTPAISEDNMMLSLDFQGCGTVTCSAGSLRNVDCKLNVSVPRMP